MDLPDIDWPFVYHITLRDRNGKVVQRRRATKSQVEMWIRVYEEDPDGGDTEIVIRRAPVGDWEIIYEGN